jgi:MYXO-CTERM domain-containing protein
LFAALDARADGLLPGPNEPSFDAALHAKALRYDRQFHTFNANLFGLSLDDFVEDADDRAALTAFLAQETEPDFFAFTTALGRPRTPSDIATSRDEHGDLGMFGGVPAAGDAFRYMVLRDRGGTAAEIDAARADLLDAIAAFHAYANITGTQGPIARGIRLTTEAGAPIEPRPATCPNAWERRDTWRADESGQHGGYHWLDNTSKDQLLGYVMALGVFWDAVAEDPSIPEQTRLDLQADALGLGRLLMQAVEVRPGTMIDLTIRDAGGCLVRFHDLNPREIVRDGQEPLVLSETSTMQNGFNALAALGIMRTLYHVSGAEELRTYYYDVLVAQRGYPALVNSGIGRIRNMFINTCVGSNCLVTNFSNVNMAFTAIWGALRYETDPTLKQTYRTILQDELWDNTHPHVGEKIQQAFFNLIYAGLKSGATDAAAATAAAVQLGQFVDPPYFDVQVLNCDDMEIAAGSCLAIDGVTTLTIDSVPSRGGGVAAVDALPKHIRPTSNFEWRSDPRTVNGGGSNRLNPGGDFRAAYWLGRYLVASASAEDNISPIARNPDGSGGPQVGQPDAGVPPGPDAGVPPDMDASGPSDGGGAAEDGGGNESDGGATSNADAASTTPDAAVDAGTAAAAAPPAAGDSCSCSGARADREVSAVFGLLFGLLLAIRRKRVSVASA